MFPFCPEWNTVLATITFTYSLCHLCTSYIPSYGREGISLSFSLTLFLPCSKQLRDLSTVRHTGLSGVVGSSLLFCLSENQSVCFSPSFCPVESQSCLSPLSYFVLGGYFPFLSSLLVKCFPSPVKRVALLHLSCSGHFHPLSCTCIVFFHVWLFSLFCPPSLFQKVFSGVLQSPCVIPQPQLWTPAWIWNYLHLILASFLHYCDKILFHTEYVPLCATLHWYVTGSFCNHPSSL